MKGTIITCMREMVVTRQGQDAWQDTLLAARLEPTSIFLPTADVDEQAARSLFQASATILGLSWQALCDAFGQHWCVVYAPRIYKSFYAKHANLRTFMLDINEMHARMTASLPRAKPPRFRVQAEGEHAFLISYESDRDLIDVAIGLTRGMATYFGQKAEVEKVSSTQFRVQF